jgi:RimJ/RimL family protein N-acetyltransferase
LDPVRLARGDGSYAEALLALSADPSIGREVWGPRTPSLTRARHILDVLGAPETAGAGYFVILANYETLVGVCRVDPLRRVEGAAEVGYLVAPAYRGRGYASAALR